MINKEFMKSLNILYVEDDIDVRQALTATLEKVFSHVYTSTNGQEALELYKLLKEKKIKIHAVVSDLNMPKMTGLELLKELRNFNKELPFVFTTAYSDSEYLLDAINFGVTAYLLKPVDIYSLMEKISEVCEHQQQMKKLHEQKTELEKYLEAINNVAVISRSDLEGTITFANDIFCEVSQYSREELIGKPHSLIRHPDMPASTFEEMWQTIKGFKTWKGKIKNQAKDGTAYYVNATIIPILDDMGEEIIEYIAIRFLTTEDELEKREFKRRVLQNIKETKQKQIQDAQQIQQLEQQLEQNSQTGFIESALQHEKKKSLKLNSQVMHYETELKKIRLKKESLVQLANEKVKKASEMVVELKDVNDKLGQEAALLKEELEEKSRQVQELEIRVNSQNKIIRDLRDVIDHREDQLDAALKGSSKR